MQPKHKKQQNIIAKRRLKRQRGIGRRGGSISFYSIMVMATVAISFITFTFTLLCHLPRTSSASAIQNMRAMRGSQQQQQQQHDGIFVITLQGTPNANPHNKGRLDSFKEAWQKSCGTDSEIHVCQGVLDDRRGYGVTRSLLNCLQMARHMDLEVTVVFEDDARLFDRESSLNFCDAVKRQSKVWADMPKDTFIAFLGGHTWTYAHQGEEKQERLGSLQPSQYLETSFSFGTYGFAVPRENFDTLLNTIKEDLAHGFIDKDGVRQTEFLSPERSWYRKAREVGKTMYAIHPLTVWHEGGFSNTWKRDRDSITGEDDDNDEGDDDDNDERGTYLRGVAT